jgi:LPS-assembly protein
MFRFILILAACLALDWFGTAARVHAQEDPLAGCKVYSANGPGGYVREGERSRLKGMPDRSVRIDCDDLQFFADQIDYVGSEGLLTATGNVLFVSGKNRISADRMTFNTRTKTGTFYNASGKVTLEGRADTTLFGEEEPDAFFYGEEIEKIGPKKYRITRGGFTACVQPTPRWELVARSVVLNLDDYVVLRNAIFRVKGVPVMYLPLFYYPIEEDNRSTGFLMPIYGSGTVKGHTITNQFFWAISRSQDATIAHNWYSKTGQAVGGEYRYVLGPGSQGGSTFNLLSERGVTPAGSTTAGPSTRSYEIVGSLTQRLPAGLFARGNANYASSIITRQLYHQDVFQATNRTRNFGGQVNGNWGPYALSVAADRQDTFQNQDTITTTGSLPRVSLSRGERPIAGLPIYFGVGGEYVTLLRSTMVNDVKQLDQGLTRYDVTPGLRVPFTRWPFLTVNSSVSWRGTYWTESMENGVQVPEAIGRRYFDFQSRITGPVFNRIFNTPGGGYAEKYKHVIEPSLTIRRTTAIDNFNRIVQLESADFETGGTTRYTYALTNRLYAKKEIAREILTAGISQSYYTNAAAVQFDPNVQSSHSGPSATNFTPVVFSLRASPTDRFQADFKTEWDPTAHAIRTLGATGMFNGTWLQASGTWSQRRVIPSLPGFDNPLLADHSLGGTTSLRQRSNRMGGTYSFNYDIRRDTFLQQRYLAYYNAQCCGVVVEYQTWNYVGNPYARVPTDRRFNVSFSLAGIGTFSNFFGALGGQQNR